MSEVISEYQSVTVFAPVSIGNVSVGFDSLGLALRPIDGQLLGDVVAIEPAIKNSFELKGDFADRLPADKESNIVWSVLQAFEAGCEYQYVRVFPLLSIGNVSVGFASLGLALILIDVLLLGDVVAI